ncbi:MAG: class I SAM-dependent RNA methyltransferase [Bdellovibrionales bacterium]
MQPPKLKRSSILEFYLVTLPGLEDVVAQEVRDWFPDFQPQVVYGGVTVMTTMSRGLAMNLVLKTPTRILVRVDRFNCKDFPKLFRNISEFPWHQWVDPACEIKVYAASKGSRLKIKSRIEETGAEAWARYQENRAIQPVSGRKIQLYVRIVDNVCTLSLDTSGERLHKRGTRPRIGEAPLRETIAAALVQLIGRTTSDVQSVEVVDPMAGSGTFLLEAAARDRLIVQREFGFDVFTRKPGDPPKLSIERPRIERLIGFEVDRKTLHAAHENLRSVSTSFFTELRNIDIFKAESLPSSDGRQRWLFCNPPYGERLEVKEPLEEFYPRLFAAAERIARPDRACFLLPAKGVKGKFPLPVGWKVLEKRRFLNGGIPVVAFVFGR